jgi:ATP adenylyltransferase
MELLWAPWRGSYVENLGKQSSCFLCEAASAKPSLENLVLAKSQKTFVLMNKYPYNSGHLMVVPFTHTSNLDNLDDQTFQDIFFMTKISIKALTEVLRPDGFNIGYNLGRAAGAGLEVHIHQHIVPRWNGDTNFMPVVFGTKVLSQSLEDLYERLSPIFHKLLDKSSMS